MPNNQETLNRFLESNRSDAVCSLIIDVQDTFVNGTMSGGTALGNLDDNLIQSINQTTRMLGQGDTVLYTCDNHKAKKSTDQSVFYMKNELDSGNDYSEMLVDELMNSDPDITDEECFTRINNIMHDGKAQDGQSCAIFGTTGFAVIINNKLYATPSNERWRRPHDAGKTLEHFQQQLRDAGVSDSDIQEHTNDLVAREQWPIHGLDAEEIEVMKNHFRERMMERFDNDALQSTVEKRLTLLGNAASGELDVRPVKPNPGVRQETIFRRMNSQGHLSDIEATVMSTECGANVAERIAYFEELTQEKQRLGDPLSTSQDTR